MPSIRTGFFYTEFRFTKSRRMKIATYNVNGVNGRLPVLLRWLEETKPDIACLQELKAPQENFPEQAILNAGYEAIWHGQKSWNGVAILSRNENHRRFAVYCPVMKKTFTAVTLKPV